MNVNMEVRFIDERKGNGVFATRDIEPGATIFEERPLVSMLLQNTIHISISSDYE